MALRVIPAVISMVSLTDLLKNLHLPSQPPFLLFSLPLSVSSSLPRTPPLTNSSLAFYWPVEAASPAPDLTLRWRKHPSITLRESRSDDRPERARKCRRLRDARGVRGASAPLSFLHASGGGKGERKMEEDVRRWNCRLLFIMMYHRYWEKICCLYYFQLRDCHKSPVKSKQPTPADKYSWRESLCDGIIVLHGLCSLDAVICVTSHLCDDSNVTHYSYFNFSFFFLSLFRIYALATCY